MSKKSGTKAVKDDTPYELRDIVLAKIRGFPAWPAMIVDPETVPSEVSKERPQKKDSWYCVRFFPAGDYAWVVTKNMSKLKKHEIEAYLNEPVKRSGELFNAYKIALDPEKWEQEKEEQRMISEEAKADEEVDELDGEEEADDDEDKPKKIKKRKRDSDAGAKTKSKPKASKAEGETTTKKKKGGEKIEKSGKTKKNGNKSKTLVESEDEGDHGDDAGPSKKTSPPPAKKSKRDKEEEGGDLETDLEAQKVKDWRHKLQRAFLSKSLPKEEDMPQYDALFNQVEDYEMPIAYLQYSKIGKVMRHIAAQDDGKVPRDTEFKFKDRAQALVNKWHQTISPAKANGTANGAVEEKSVDADKDKAGSAEIKAADDSAKTDAGVDGKENGAPAQAEAVGTGEAVAEGKTEDVAMADA